MRSRVILFATVASAALSTAASAQVVVKDALTFEGAKRIMAAAETEARKQNFPASIAIVDEGGNLLMMERLDDWIVASAKVAVGKARTSAIFRRPTGAFEDIIRNGRTAMVALDDFTPLQGGVPIVYNGKVIGAIGVSGNNPPKDEEIAQIGANAIAGLGASERLGPATVTYFDKDQVAGAFAKGAVLYDGEGGNYMIHASRRDATGMAEVHTQDADLIYVQGGSASLVTGGRVIEPKNVAADEIRGASIQGGTRRRLAKGDVIIVPRNTPHWFEKIEGTFTYYVVKVR